MDVREVADRCEVVEHVIGVAPLEHGVVPEPVGDAVDPTGGIVVLLPVPDGPDGIRVERDRDLRVRPHNGAQRIDRQAVGEQEVVSGRHRGPRFGAARRMHTGAIAQHRRTPWLVDRRPTTDPITQRSPDEAGVVAEAFGGVADRPASSVLEGLRKIPVVERHHRLDPVGEEGVDQVPVEVEAGARRPAPGGLDPGPGDRETVRAEAEGRDELDVSLHAMTVVGRDAGVAPTTDPSRNTGELVPDRRAPAIPVDAPLDLSCGGGHAPQELGREAPNAVSGRHQVAAEARAVTPSPSPR